MCILYPDIILVHRCKDICGHVRKKTQWTSMPFLTAKVFSFTEKFNTTRMIFTSFNTFTSLYKMMEYAKVMAVLVLMMRTTI